MESIRWETENPQLRFIHTHQLFRRQYTWFELETVIIDWWICINVCLVLKTIIWCDDFWQYSNQLTVVLYALVQTQSPDETNAWQQSHHMIVSIFRSETRRMRRVRGWWFNQLSSPSNQAVGRKCALVGVPWRRSVSARSVYWEVGRIRLETSSSLFGLKQTYHQPHFMGSICVNTEGYGFIEFENANSPVSTVFRQPLIYDRFPTPPRSVKIHQRGVQWKQGVVVHIVLQAVLLYNTTPIHCTPLPLHPPLMNTQTRSGIFRA